MAQDRGSANLRGSHGWTALAGLGVVTIVAYGACYYAFGAFVRPGSVASPS